MLAKYCLGCHSQKMKKGDLDLERFTSLELARRDLKVWQSLTEMLGAEEMPPKEKPQPSPDERKWLITWTHHWLAAEARAHADDPGPAPLRRLSNAEYDATIRDITGVDLKPAREFPADGAAGEGFTNAAEALSMSPALVDKYLAAAKSIADHAVLLPEGLRFSPASQQRDWVDESLAALRMFYKQYTEADGRLPVRRYLNVLQQNRAAITAGTKKFADIAAAERLSPKYLEILWRALNDTKPSFVLDEIRARWKTASPADVEGIAQQIDAWQKLAWTIISNGAGLYEPWQTPSLAISDSQTLRFKLNPTATQGDVVVFLVAQNVNNAAKANGKTLVLWDKARLEGNNQPPLALRDVSDVANRLERSLRDQFADTAKYLNAIARWRRGAVDESLDAIAKHDSLDPKRLRNWIDAVGLQKDLLGLPEPLTVKMHDVNGKPPVSGWGSPTNDQLPSLFANSSDQTLQIPGTVPPHGVTVHPTPDQYAAVSWKSPMDGVVHIETKVADAHAGCGNGVAWWLDTLRGKERTRLTNGEFDDGKAATIPPHDLQVKLGDRICLTIGARNRDHVCDLTLIELNIRETGGKNRVWNLGHDIADTVLAGNPHDDRLGNSGTWEFSRGRDNSSAKSGIDIPAGSPLMKWREALESKRPEAELAKLADEIQRSLTESPTTSGGSATAKNLEAAQFAALTARGSPLVTPVSVEQILKSRDPKQPAAPAASRFGLELSRFGKHPDGHKIDDASFVSDSPAVIEIHLPACRWRPIANWSSREKSTRPLSAPVWCNCRCSPARRRMRHRWPARRCW